jgi:UDP-glucose 4-epimerase
LFSSICASFSIPELDQLSISEDCPQRPVNPYGSSKAMLVQLLEDFSDSYSLPS